MTSGYPFQFSTPREETWLTRFDPRVRFLALFVVLVAISLVLKPVSLAVISVTLILALVVLRIESNMLIKLLPYFLLMAAITLILARPTWSSTPRAGSVPFGVARA